MPTSYQNTSLDHPQTMARTAKTIRRGLTSTSTESLVANYAVRNYEIFHQLVQGSATLDQVASSSAGIQGWALLDKFRYTKR